LLAIAGTDSVAPPSVQPHSPETACTNISIRRPS
jgi:hypothetical protein